MASKAQVYAQIIERVFFDRYDGGEEVPFEREALRDAAKELGLPVPDNLGDVVYSFRYRRELPQPIQDVAPPDKHWVIRPAGRAKYRFVASGDPRIQPNELIRPIK